MPITGKTGGGSGGKSVKIAYIQYFIEIYSETNNSINTHFSCRIAGFWPKRLSKRGIGLSLCGIELQISGNGLLFAGIKLPLKGIVLRITGISLSLGGMGLLFP